MDPYYYTTYSSTEVDPGTMLAIFVGAAVFGLVLYAVFAFFLSKIFKKAGEQQWKAWVPIYNQWVFLELGGQQGWLALLALAGVIPFIGWIGAVVAFVFMCLAAYQIGLNLQKEGWFVVLYILVSPVWLIWLAVDSSTWKAAPVAAGSAPNNQAPAPEPSSSADTPVSQPPIDAPDQNDTTPKPPTV